MRLTTRNSNELDTSKWLLHVMISVYLFSSIKAEGSVLYLYCYLMKFLSGDCVLSFLVWLREAILICICSQSLHMKCPEFACFTSVAQMLLYPLSNSLYLTFLPLSNYKSKCIYWLKLETYAKQKWVCRPYFLFKGFGGLTLASSQMPTYLISLSLPSRAGRENRMQKLVGQDKVMEIAY